MDVYFCKSALEEALSIYGKPDIFNSDQGSQFTSKEFTGCLKQENIQISMDGRGRCYDNIFIERLWRFLKYELIYICSFEDGKHLTEEVKKWFNLSWVNSPLLAAKNLKLQWKPSVCEQNIFHTPSACSGVVHFL
jgi:putative transposase